MRGLERVASLLSRNYKPVGTSWVMLSCPLAEWTHPDGDDKRPSFGVSPVGFNCFTCGIKGHLSQLPKVLARYTHEYPYLIAEAIEECLEEYQTTCYGTPKNTHKETLPLELLDQYEIAHPNLELTKKDIEKWDIRQVGDTLLFPIFNRDKSSLLGIKCRSISNRKQFWHIGQNVKGEGRWYGEWLLTAEEMVAVVEGERDAILLGRAIPTLAAMGLPTDTQIETFASMKVPKKILAFDNDKAGSEITKKVKKRLSGEVYSLDLSGYKDPAEMIAAGVRKLKFKRLNFQNERR